jgi:hypothetical protein
MTLSSEIMVFIGFCPFLLGGDATHRDYNDGPSTIGCNI